MSAHSNATGAPSKSTKRPKKPYTEYPLYCHPLGYWSKKVHGKIVHFGRWGRVRKGSLVLLPYEESWREALAAYKARIDDAQSGNIEGVVIESEAASDMAPVLVKDICNAFRTAKQKKMKAGRLGHRMYDEYVSVTDMLVEQLGRSTRVDSLTAKRFEQLREYMELRWGPVRLANQITRVKSVFKYAYEAELIKRPLPYLQSHSSIFAPPSKDELRRHRSKSKKKMFSSEDCRKQIEAAGVPLKAMILLGLNCGFGNHDCATLPLTAVDLEAGWIDYPRPKSGIERRCPLWPETVTALREAIEHRSGIQGRRGSLPRTDWEIHQ